MSDTLYRRAGAQAFGLGKTERMLMVRSFGLHCCNVAAAAGLCALGLLIAKSCAVAALVIGSLVVQ